MRDIIEQLAIAADRHQAAEVIASSSQSVTNAMSVQDFTTLSETEKIAQVLLVSMDYDEAEKYRPLIEKGLVGHVLLQWGNYSLEETRALTERLAAWAGKSPHAVPLLIYADYEGGTVFTPVTLGLTDLPTNMMLGAANDPRATETLFHLAGLEMRRAGIHMSFAPVLDVNTNPKNPIIGVRSFGCDPVRAAELGEAVITGLKSAGVGAVAKHFPGHGDTAVDSHFGLPVIVQPQATFFQTHLFPFQIAANAGVTGIMSAHILFKDMDDANPATFSRKILTGLLRERMEFKGLIYSDSLDMRGALKLHGIAEGAVATINAGTDVAILGKGDAEKAQAALAEAMNSPEFKTRLETAARRVWEQKQRMGLFEKGFNVDFSIDKAYSVYAGKLSQQAVTLVRGKPEFAADGSGKKLCALFFTPPRFGDKLAYFDMPFLNAGWLVTHYNASVTPTRDDLAFAADCVASADAVAFGSFQWAATPNTGQINAIENLMPDNKPCALVSLMSPYDIPFFNKAKNVLALYGISRFSAAGAANILLGTAKPAGTMPISFKPLN
ncbi:MAG: glycoside hydrolase family 3 protein [Elusimicrobiaceae bacterium]|nr:glycoside hydrolase family 3 protein [Elusimicrobiaceae bacterium]